jgi:hypothetical protein
MPHLVWGFCLASQIRTGPPRSGQFGEMRTRARIYSEHAGMEKGKARCLGGKRQKLASSMAEWKSPKGAFWEEPPI